jgi:hypothetical protein
MARQRRVPAVQHRYVVDASVAKAANRGKEIEAARAQRCRLFMLAILKGVHFLIMTDDIRREWEHRASRWSDDWYASMARKRQVRWVVPANCAEIEAAIGEAPVSNASKAAMKKDLRLVAAVLSSNREIVTLDAKSRSLFEELADSLAELRTVRWLDPIDDPLPITLD